MGQYGCSLLKTHDMIMCLSITKELQLQISHYNMHLQNIYETMKALNPPLPPKYSIKTNVIVEDEIYDCYKYLEHC